MSYGYVRVSTCEDAGDQAPDTPIDAASSMTAAVDNAEENYLKLEADIYDAAAAAAFGGVSASVSKDSSMPIHPVFFFPFFSILFILQCSILMCLRFESSFNDTISGSDLGHHGHLLDQGMTMVLRTQLLMIFIVQVELFKDMFRALRLTSFLMNPLTWSTIQRPEPSGESGCIVRWAFAPLALSPCPVLAQLLKLVILYQVSVDSISIVLSCETAKDAVFNGLALKFVVELDKMLWNTVAHLERLDDFHSFPFYSKSHRSTRKAGMLACCRSMFGYLLTFVCLGLMYLRQVAIVLHALETDTLPVSRDICTMWRWKEHKEQYMHSFAVAYRWIIIWIPLFSVDGNRWTYIESVCNGDNDYERLRIGGIVKLFQNAYHFQMLMYCSAAVASCALAPYVLRCVLCLNPDKIQQIRRQSTLNDPMEQRMKDMEKTVVEAQDEIEALRLQVQDLMQR